jgi:hypothetical protein
LRDVASRQLTPQKRQVDSPKEHLIDLNIRRQLRQCSFTGDATQS